MALAQGADLLILDEPTTSLDPVMMDDLLRVLIEDHTGENHTIFISSHVLAEIEKIADWIGIIDRGKLLLEARLDDIRADYRRVRVSGTGLPLNTTTQIISAYEQNGIVDYYVSTRVQEFAAGLHNCGATVLDIWPVPLQELFLQLMRRS
jgi:ABC-2 type transport system ATP-binding protein